MLIGITNLTFEFGARTIVRDATWHIQPGERIGLIGYNGTGKSTLLKLLVGDYQPTAGTVERGRDVRLGYLHQDLLSTAISKTILEVAMDAFSEARKIQADLAAMEKRLETEYENEQLLHDYAERLHDFEVAGGYTMEHRAAEVLHGLGFSDDQLSQQFETFSGGWRMRVLLAQMILKSPDVLLLDEPTNHLDLPSIEWLEKYLVHYPGSVIIVSHDKFFLNRMVNKIVELYQQEIHQYTGNYEFYEREKVERIELQKRAYENQQEYIRQQERFIERFKAKATKAAQAQSAMQRLDKIDRIEDVELERPNIRINFMVGQQPGKIICTLKDISKSFGNNRVIDHSTVEINRGDKVALIGANGKGKSTMLRIVAGMEKIDGERIWGHNVQEAFYAQHQLEALDVNNTILQEMGNSRAGKTELEYRSLLGGFLFGGDDVEKKIKVLSGGEKARVALAKTIVSKANFLMLDEPTNHLDMVSVELLAEALNKYEGSYILVSHDRYFISKTANVFWEIIDKKIREFRGTWDEYLVWRERWKAEAAAAPKEEEKPKPAAPPPPPVANNKAIDKEAQKQQQKLQRQFEQLEKEMELAGAQKAELEMKLADPELYKNKDQFVEIEIKLQNANKRYQELKKDYETIFDKLLSN